MIRFKRMDAWASIALMTAGIITSIIKWDRSILTIYFLVGGWQSFSIFTHLGFNWFSHSKARLIYYTITASLLALFSVAGIIPGLNIPVIYFLFFISPVMFIYYTYVCYQEAYVALRRPLAQLK